MVNVHDRFFYSVYNGFQLVWYAFAVLSHCPNDYDAFVQGLRCQRDRREVSIHRDPSPSGISGLPAYGKLKIVLRYSGITMTSIHQPILSRFPVVVLFEAIVATVRIFFHQLPAKLTGTSSYISYVQCL